MDMAQDGVSKKVSSLLDKKDGTNEDLTPIRKEAEETNTTMGRSEIFVSGEPREYVLKNRSTLTSKVKATFKKVGKILRKAKPRKKRTTMYSILASTLKFHKDDVDPADAESSCWS